MKTSTGPIMAAEVHDGAISKTLCTWVIQWYEHPRQEKTTSQHDRGTYFEDFFEGFISSDF